MTRLSVFLKRFRIKEYAKYGAGGGGGGGSRHMSSLLLEDGTYMLFEDASHIGLEGNA